MLHRRPFAEPLVALAFALLASIAGSGEARASTPTEAELNQAREQFSIARRLEDEGHWAEALTVFQRISEVKMTPQVRFHIALCLENVGLWTQALDAYVHAAGEASDAASDVIAEANDHVHKLEASIPTVRLHVASAAAGDEILLDRRRLSADEQSMPIRADPGPHTAEVWRGGVLVARAFFALDPRSSREVELRPGAVAPEPQQAARGGNLPASAQRALGWTAIGGGVASAAVMGVFIGLRANARSQLDAACPTHAWCPTTVAATVADGKTYSALANVFGVLGGVAAGAGAVLLITTPVAAPRAPTQAAPPAVWVSLRADGLLSLGGTF